MTTIFRHSIIVFLTICFLNLKGQENANSSIIPFGSKATIILETEDSINFSYKLQNIEKFTETINSRDNENEIIFTKEKTNCIELIFCNGNYGDGSPMTFLFIKNWYKFSIEYGASIIKSSKNSFENTSVAPLFPSVLSREDWPYKIEKIKLSRFKKILFTRNQKTEQSNNTYKINYIGYEKADSAFASLFNTFNLKIDDFNLRQVDSIEQKKESKDITPDKYFELGKDIYPNTKQFKLEIPKTYLKIEDSTFTNQIEYYFTKKDYSIKAILFEWNQTENNMNDLFSLDNNLVNKAKMFQNKFNWIENYITTQVGAPTQKNIESKQNIDPFRDDVIWESSNGLVVYMFMFGNESQHYRQIRMTMYKK